YGLTGRKDLRVDGPEGCLSLTTGPRPDLVHVLRSLGRAEPHTAATAGARRPVVAYLTGRRSDGRVRHRSDDGQRPDRGGRAARGGEHRSGRPASDQELTSP